MAPEPITRRRALGAGAAALAAVTAAPPTALARRPALFELALDGSATASAASAGWRATPVLRAPRRFDLIGLRWAAASDDVQAQVRARRDRGGWSDWVALHRSGDHAPDGARAIVDGTEPAWTDSADVFQLRLRGSVRGLRARFVRAKPTAQVSGAVARRLRRRARAVAATRRPAPAGSTRAPEIVTRSEWGADSVPPRAEPAYGEVQLAFVHHTVTANDYGPEDSASIVLGIARYHRDSNKWNDIGYNFLVDKYGQVFEGRAGGMEAAVLGAQAQGYNAHSTGVACLGDFQAIPQSEAGLAALSDLLAWKLALHGVPATGQVTVTSNGGASSRERAGTPVTFQRISGHRDADETTCPGNGLYAQLPALRDAVVRKTGSTGASALTAHVSARRLRYPARLTLSGRLRFADGSPASGAPVALEFQAPGTGWQSLGTTTCDESGNYASAIEPPSSGLVRAAFAGDGARPAIAAAPVAVTVVPRLAARLSARRVRRRTAVSVTGTVTPRPADGRVVCLVERQVGGRWYVVTRKRIAVRRGTFATVVRPRSGGPHRVTVLTAGASRRFALQVTTAAGRGGGANAS